jgi:hypothetical protein
MNNDHYEHVRKWRKETKRKAVAALGGKCVICGYSECQKALDCHHRNPKEKEFAVTNTIRSWKKIVSELRKCVLLCKVCHVEFHEGIVSLPESIPSFDESYAQERLLLNPCPVCGKMKSHRRKTCSLRCFAKTREKIDWSKYDIQTMLKTMSPEQISRIVGVTGNAIRKRIKNHF